MLTTVRSLLSPARVAFAFAMCVVVLVVFGFFRSEPPDSVPGTGGTAVSSEEAPARPDRERDPVAAISKQSDPVVGSEQQESAFLQMQNLLAGETRRGAGHNVELARFAGPGGQDQQWVEEDFAVHSDEYENVVAHNPAQGFEADFTELGKKGLRVRHHYGANDLRVRLVAIGASREAMNQIGEAPIEPMVDGSQVKFNRGGGITEWYRNGKDGLEQGWAIDEPLSDPEEGGELRLSLQMDAGRAIPLFEPGDRRDGRGDAIVFRDGSGSEEWRYDKLHVFDAEGVELPSRMEWDRPVGDSRGRLDLVVDATGAGYPLTVDPMISSNLAHLDTASADSTPADLLEINGMLFFSARGVDIGRELWVSDGTTEGTRLVKDIHPGFSNSDPGQFVDVDGTLFFHADDGVHGSELWKSDGTTVGTVLVKDINSGDASSNPGELTAMNGTLFFRADNGVHGLELWKSDGTDAGTQLVKNINPGAALSFPTEITAVGNTLFFQASNGTNGNELWKSDGTSAGTVLLKDIRPGATSSNPGELTNVAGGLFFRAHDGVHGTELWTSDGTSAGTTQVKDINPGGSHSGPSEFTPMDSFLYFSAFESTSGFELWKSDGTAAGTVLVEDINQGSTNSNPESLTAVAGTLFFAADDGTYGKELWKSDGTVAGTQLVKNINPGAAGALPTQITAVGNTLFFAAYNGTNGSELWKSDGTAAGTMLVRDISPGIDSSFPAYLTEFGGALLFRADDGVNGKELWVSDGTTPGTRILRDAYTRDSFSNRLDSVVRVGGALFFEATDTEHGGELWTSDGTVGGTFLVKDINPGAATSLPSGLFSLGDRFLFAATDASRGREIWISDGTPVGTQRISDINPGASSSSPYNFTLFGNDVIFTADDGSNGRELWRFNGANDTVNLVKDILPGATGSGPTLPIELDGKLIFAADDGTHGYELWTTDGSTAGTMLVKDIRPGTGSSNPGSSTLSFPDRWMYPLGDKLGFFANDGTTGFEPWVSDGTPSGTYLLKDINPAGSSSTAAELSALIDDTWFFAGDDGTHGDELWATDGTAANTRLVKDINPGLGSSLPWAFSRSFGQSTSRIGDDYVFYADDATHGRELWKSDGTAGGTTLVKDIRPGLEGSSSSVAAGGPARNGDQLFFHPDDGVHGLEPWVTDGSTAGTTLFKDFIPGSAGDYTNQVEVGNKLFISAAGRIWISDGTPAGTVLDNTLFPAHETIEVGSFLPFDDGLLYTVSNPTGGMDIRFYRPRPPLRINELDAIALSDGREFIELFDGGEGNTALDAFTLVLFDGDTDTSYRAIDLTGQSTDANGYFVVGAASTPNVDLVLPDGFLQDGADAVALYEAAHSDFPNGTAVAVDGRLVDAVAHDTGQADDTGLLALLDDPAEPQLDENEFSNTAGHSLQRFPNGSGGARLSGSFDAFAATPGEENTRPPAPGAPVLLPSSDSGTSNSDGITKDTTPTFRVTARPGASVVIFGFNGVGFLDPVTADVSGVAEITAPPLAEGTDIQFRAKADESAWTTGLAVTIDTTPPASPGAPDLYNLDDSGSSNTDNITSDTTPTLNGTTPADSVLVTLYDDMTPIGTDTSPDATWTVTSPALADGSRSVSASATDLAGNESTKGTALAVTIDTTGPTLTFGKAGGQDDPATGGPILFTAAFNENVTGFDETDVTVGGTAGGTSSVSGGPATYTVSVTTTASEGTVTASVGAGAAVDPAGNTSGTPTPGDTSVSLDTHGGDGGNATDLSFSGDSASADGFLEPSDTDVFAFTLIEPATVVAETTGSTDTRGTLFTDSGNPLNSPEDDRDSGGGNNFRIEEILPPGTYHLFVTSEGSAQTGAYSLSITKTAFPILINEFDVQTQGGDTREFVELFDGGAGGTSLNGLVLVFFDGGTDTSYQAINLDGHSTDGDGYFVIGNSAVSNVDLVVSDGAFQNGADAIGLYSRDTSDFPNGTPTTTTTLIDAVVYDTGQADDTGLLALLLPSEPQLDEDGQGNAEGHSLQRIANGSGGVRSTSAFSLLSPTPGTVNSLPAAPGNLDLTDASDSGDSRTDDLTNDDTPTITGTARPGSSITLTSQIDGLAGSGVADANGDWSITTTPLSEAIQNLTASADGSPASAPLSIDIDLTAPTVTVNPAAGQDDPASVGPILFTAMFSEDVTGFESGDVSTGGNAAGAVDVSGGPSTFNVSVTTTAPEGFITSTIPVSVAADLAGNFNAASTSSDNRVDLDTDTGAGGSPTELPLNSGSASFSGFLHGSDTDTFAFTLNGTRITTLLTTGSLDTRGSLEDASDALLNDPDADDDAGDNLNFQIVETLGAGDYEVTVSSTGEGNYELSLETALLPTPAPLPPAAENALLISKTKKAIKKLKEKIKKAKKSGNVSKAKKLKSKLKKLKALL